MGRTPTGRSTFAINAPARYGRIAKGRILLAGEYRWRDALQGNETPIDIKYFIVPVNSQNAIRSGLQNCL